MDPMEHETNFEALTKQAEQSLKALLSGERNWALKQKTESHKVIAAIYAVHLDGRNHAEALEKFLLSRKAAKNPRAQNDFHRTMTAFVPMKERAGFKQRISQYAQCMHVLHVNDVSANDAADWIGKEETVGGKKLSGLAKMLRLYADLEEVVARNAERAQETERKKKAKIKEALEKLKETRNEAVLDEELGVEPDKPVILIGFANGINLVISRVIEDENELHRLAQHKTGKKEPTLKEEVPLASAQPDSN
jgi:hypothetical protein